MSADPDIQAAWDDAQTALANMLRPYLVPEDQADRLAKRFIDGLEQRGWRPPLAKPPDWRTEALIRRQAAGSSGEAPGD